MAEEIKLIPITTTAGLQKFFQVSGLPEVRLKLTHIGFGDAGYTPEKSQTSLKNEIIRVPIASGKVFPSDGYMDLSALLPEDAPEFWIREIGWYLEDGTLAFVWSHPEVPIAWKNKNLKLLTGISVRVTDVPLDKIEIVESNPDLKLLYTEEFAQISRILTNHEIAIVAIKEKADEAIATANAVKEELENVHVPRITVLEERADKTEENLLLEQLTDQTVLARIGQAITTLTEKLNLVNTSKLQEVEEEIDRIEKLLQQVKDKVDSDVVAGFQKEIDSLKSQVDSLKDSKADKTYVDNTFVKTTTLEDYATKSYVDNNFTKTADFATSKRRFSDSSPTLRVGDSIVVEFDGTEAKVSSILGKGIYTVAVFVDDCHGNNGTPVIQITDNKGNVREFKAIGDGTINDDAFFLFRLFCGNEGLTIVGEASYDIDTSKGFNSTYSSFNQHFGVDASTVKDITFKVLDNNGSAISIAGKLSITKLI
ncbi:phage tail protein [Desulfurobacterium thermolithotrophum]|uniref:phage tail-collar fiber domain-containing protein n=1 Tax=Desulfurobacterium thermolithotrophum TaxID=64160 RepID=UPI0013D674E7|nr:phage tail protein [Desulfurobacterium thermolithotrophum]